MQNENNENPYYIHPEIEESLCLSSRQCPFLFRRMYTSSSNSDTSDDENSKLNRNILKLFIIYNTYKKQLLSNCKQLILELPDLECSSKASSSPEKRSWDIGTINEESENDGCSYIIR